jgi:hypothetical protein
MFLHFHGKYNMILFVLKIINHMQIKTFNSSFFYLFYFFNIYKTYIKKYKNTHTHIAFYYAQLTHHFYMLQNNKNSK